MLAVIIPYYKRKFFEETLASLAAQTNKNFQVYIGDDASPEVPSRLIEEFSSKFNIHYHRFDQNIGKNSLTAHWDRCISLNEKEEYLMVLGDDDILGENVVATFYKHLDNLKKSPKLFRFASAMIDENSKITTEVFKHPAQEKATDAFFRKFKGFTRSSLSEYIFKREVYEKRGFYPYPLGWHSDDRAWLEFAGSEPIHTINDAVIYIRNSSENISSKKDNLHEKFEATHNFYNYILSSWLEEFDTDRKYGLINAYEELLRNGKVFNFKEWLFLFKLHLEHFRYRNFKKFVKSSLL